MSAGRGEEPAEYFNCGGKFPLRLRGLQKRAPSSTTTKLAYLEFSQELGEKLMGSRSPSAHHPSTSLQDCEIL